MQQKPILFIIPVIIIFCSLQFSNGRGFLNETAAAFSSEAKKCNEVKLHGNSWYDICKSMKKKCIVPQGEDTPTCECKEDRADFISKYMQCVPRKCIEVKLKEEIWYDVCRTVGKECIVPQGRETPTCECEEDKDFVLEDMQCVQHCSHGTSSAKECKRLGRNCHIVKQQPFYECRCPNWLIEINGTCADYCALGEEGKRLCDGKHRTCEPLRIPPLFLCKECQGGFEENKNRCVRVCERNSTSGVKCKEMNRKCEYTEDYPFYQCGDCEEGLVEIEGLCVRRKTVKEINPLQLLLIKSLKTTEEKQVLLYKPPENHSLFDLSSLLDLK